MQTGHQSPGGAAGRRVRWPGHGRRRQRHGLEHAGRARNLATRGDEGAAHRGLRRAAGQPSPCLSHFLDPRRLACGCRWSGRQCVGGRTRLRSPWGQDSWRNEPRQAFRPKKANPAALAEGHDAVDRLNKATGRLGREGHSTLLTDLLGDTRTRPATHAQGAWAGCGLAVSMPAGAASCPSDGRYQRLRTTRTTGRGRQQRELLGAAQGSGGYIPAT